MNSATITLAAILNAACLSLVAAPASLATVIHVPADQPTIQAGINVAQPGDVVLVAPGTYSGPDNQDLDFFGMDISVVSEAGSQTTIIDPILDGQGVGRGFFLHSGETASALIEGFTIRDGGDPTYGSGILLQLASPTIRNCVLTGNASPGMEVRGQNVQGGPWPEPIVEGCTFEANAVAGVRFMYANGVFRDCTFTANAGRGIILEGGYWGGGSPTFERCTIAANTAGGINVVSDGQATLTDCVIRDHVAGSGPGMRDNSEHGRHLFRRCTFLHNAVGGYVQSGLDVRGAAFEDCTFEANSPAVSYFNFRGPAVGVLRCRFLNNSTPGSGGAIALFMGNITVDSSVFWNNTAGQIGGAVAAEDARVTLRSCTIAGGGAPRGAGLASSYNSDFVLERTIVAFSSQGEAVSCGDYGSVAANCCDFFGNAGGDWVGCVAGMNGVNGNISADPLFCDMPAGDFTIADTSPCAPQHSGGCDLIGALPVDCGLTAVHPTTWGAIKATYR